MHDAIIVGARCAGSSTAAADAGADVRTAFTVSGLVWDSANTG